MEKLSFVCCFIIPNAKIQKKTEISVKNGIKKNIIFFVHKKSLTIKQLNTV